MEEKYINFYKKLVQIGCKSFIEEEKMKIIGINTMTP
jgi:hypothetical protein